MQQERALQLLAHAAGDDHDDEEQPRARRRCRSGPRADCRARCAAPARTRRIASISATTTVMTNGNEQHAGADFRAGPAGRRRTPPSGRSPRRSSRQTISESSSDRVGERQHEDEGRRERPVGVERRDAGEHQQLRRAGSASDSPSRAGSRPTSARLAADRAAGGGSGSGRQWSRWIRRCRPIVGLASAPMID